MIVAALQKHSGRVCPLECGRGTVARGETCVAVAKPEPKKSRRAERNTRSAPTRVRSRQAAPAAAPAAPEPVNASPPTIGMGGVGGMMFFGGFGRRRF
jgi:hypothetical protein